MLNLLRSGIYIITKGVNVCAPPSPLVMDGTQWGFTVAVAGEVPGEVIGEFKYAEEPTYDRWRGKKEKKKEKRMEHFPMGGGHRPPY